MPKSLHKTLIDGLKRIKGLVLSIGLFSEEAQEVRNKNLNFINKHHSRKVSRMKTNEDVMISC